MWLKVVDSFLVGNIGTIIEWEIVIFISLVVFLSGRKLVCIYRDNKEEENKQSYYNIVGKYLEGDIDDEQENWYSIFPRTMSFRNFLADVGANIQGDFRLKILKLYKVLGFYKSDVQVLGSHNVYKRLRGIDRLEKLSFDIPEDIHLQLLDDRNYMVRFLAMLHLVNQNGSESLFPLISYIDQKKYKKRGLMYSLIEKLGQKDPSAIAFLFARTNSRDLEISLLNSAVKKPPKDFDDILYRKVRVNGAKSIVVGALKVLTYFPSEKLLKLVNILSADQRWVVRLHVVKLIRQFSFADIEHLLIDFFDDPSYLVRLEATKILLEFIEIDDLNAQILGEELKKKKGHPAQVILKHLMDVQHIRQEQVA